MKHPSAFADMIIANTGFGSSTMRQTVARLENIRRRILLLNAVCHHWESPDERAAPLYHDIAMVSRRLARAIGGWLRANANRGRLTKDSYRNRIVEYLRSGWISLRHPGILSRIRWLALYLKALQQDIILTRDTTSAPAIRDLLSRHIRDIVILTDLTADLTADLQHDAPNTPAVRHPTQPSP